MAEEESKKTTEEESEETAGEEAKEESPEKEVPEESPQIGGGDFFSPAAIILFFTAVLIDIASLIVLCFGVDDFGILDITGLIFVGGLMYIHAGTATVSKGAQKLVKKTSTTFLKKIGLAFLGEVIPYFGSVAPCWTLAVYFHLKGK